MVPSRACCRRPVLDALLVSNKHIL